MLWVVTTASGLGSIPSKAPLFGVPSWLDAMFRACFGLVLFILFLAITTVPLSMLKQGGDRWAASYASTLSISIWQYRRFT